MYLVPFNIFDQELDSKKTAGYRPLPGQPELDNQYISTNSASVPMMVGSPKSQWQYYGGKLGQMVSK